MPTPSNKNIGYIEKYWFLRVNFKTKNHSMVSFKIKKT